MSSVNFTAMFRGVVIEESLDRDHAWYADFKTNQTHFVICRGKLFKVDRSQGADGYKPAVAYGLKLGIPEYQLDFSPDIKEWQRS